MKAKLQFCAWTLFCVSTAASIRAAVHYVNVNSTNPIAPYTNWATAATVIQDAVDVALPGDEILVTNGVYQTGWRVAQGALVNRVAVTKPIVLRSANGPAETVILGGPGRCVYLGVNARLTGFTLTGGQTFQGGDFMQVDRSGGGVWCESTNAIVSNCVLIGNNAENGGGAAGGTLQNCILRANQAGRGGIGGAGGGAANARLQNCTVVYNRSTYTSGGASQCVLNNCIVYDNEATVGPNHTGDEWPPSDLNYCCTLPLPTGGVGNITNTPSFVNPALGVDPGIGNFRLQSNSSCINAGRNSYAPFDSDLDGNARIAGGTVDIGAYEFQSPQSAISYAWLQQHGLRTDASADFADSDGDSANNWQEWRAGTDPANPLSMLRLLTPSADASGLLVRWSSISNRTYSVERSTNLTAQPAFVPIAGNIAGQAGFTAYRDTNVLGMERFFYRVRVNE